MSCGRCEAEAKAHGPDGTCPADMDEPKCGTHGIRFMFDGEDHDGKPVVQCVACLLLQIEKLKDKYETCEQCDGSTGAGVFCVPCWNRINLQVREMTEDRDAWTAKQIETSNRLVEALLRNSALETVIKTVLDDSESKPGGWGPDRTMTFVLANALKREGLCTNDRDGEKCLRAAGHEGICEGPQHVWDWKPTYGKRKV